MRSARDSLEVIERALKVGVTFDRLRTAQHEDSIRERLVDATAGTRRAVLLALCRRAEA